MATLDTVKEKGKKLLQAIFVDKPDEYKENRKAGMRALYKKEVLDYFRSVRFLLVLLLIGIIGIAGVISAGSAIKGSISSGSDSGDTYTFLSIFTTGGVVPLSLVDILTFLGPIVGLALGFDAISGERSRRTLSRLLAQPIYRDTVIKGKFFAGVTIISIIVFSVGIIVGGLGVVLTGLPPTFEEFARLLIFCIYTVVYMSFWLSISLLLSLLFQNVVTSALSGFGLWVLSILYYFFIPGMIVNALYPGLNTQDANQMESAYSWYHGLNLLSPLTLYREPTSAILDPTLRTLGLITQTQANGALVGVLPLGQSILLVWPHLTALIALTIIVFAISYICFMRQEIRA